MLNRSYPMTFHAPPNRILVRQVEKISKIGSIHVPQGSEDYPPIGEILSVGSKIVDSELVVGMRVMFVRRAHGKGGGALIPDSREGGEDRFKDVVCLQEDDIFAIVED